jgi:hypothetical protein
VKFILFTIVFTFCVGCSSRVIGPDVIVLDSQSYTAAFDAAVNAANTDGMTPILLDRRGGIITTNPVVAGSFLEPWKPKPSSARQGLENTLAQQRRTARFEFVPVLSMIVKDNQTDKLVGPNFLSSTGLDLTTYQGELELRVWVYVDRKYTQGIRRNTWSLRQETRTKVFPTEKPWEQVAGSFWTPISRDVARERDLLASVEMQKNAQ